MKFMVWAGLSLLSLTEQHFPLVSVKRVTSMTPLMRQILFIYLFIQGDQVESACPRPNIYTQIK